jgi:hypothetical protein
MAPNLLILMTRHPSTHPSQDFAVLARDKDQFAAEIGAIARGLPLFLRSPIQKVGMTFPHYHSVSVFNFRPEMRKEREAWAPAFAKLGMTTEQVMQLSGTEFANYRDFLELEGFKPGPQPPVDEEAMQRLVLEAIRKKAQMKKARPVIRQPIVKRDRPGVRRASEPAAVAAVVAEHFALREAQDREYEEVLREAQQQKEEDEVQKVEKDGGTEDLKEERREKARNLAPEPSAGLTLAVDLPNRRRVVRRFAKDSIGSAVIDWIGGEEEMLGGEMEVPLNFELRSVSGAPIVRESTLEEQGIANRTLFNVFVQK